MSGAPRLEPDPLATLSAVHRYLLDWSLKVAGSTSASRILDLGCGGADVVAAGRRLGLDIYGAEAFYDGGSTRNAVAAKGLLGDVVRELDEGRIAFASQSFDLVLSNQVFEHVEDLDLVLTEIERVLRPGGLLLCLFPSRDVLREGHIGIPLVHRLPPGGLRLHYTLILRRLGFGYHKLAKSPRRWAVEALEWIDRYTVYRPRDEILTSLSRRFSVEPLEQDYIRFRLGRHRPPGSTLAAALLMAMRQPLLARLGGWLVRKLAGLVLLARKESA